MEKRIVYRTVISVSNMMLDVEKEMVICSEKIRGCFLEGCIFRYSRRKLFGIIQLPDKYVHKVYFHLFVRNKYTNEVYVKELSSLSFESKKRLMEEQQNLESWLRNKCKQYKQSKQEE